MGFKFLSALISALLVFCLMPSAALAGTQELIDGARETGQPSGSAAFTDGLEHDSDFLCAENSSGEKLGTLADGGETEAEEGSTGASGSVMADEKSGETESSRLASSNPTIAELPSNEPSSDERKGAEAKSGCEIESGDYFIAPSAAPDLALQNDLVLQDRKANNAQTWTISYNAETKSATMEAASKGSYLAVSNGKLVLTPAVCDEAEWKFIISGSSYIVTNVATGLLLDVKGAVFKLGTSVQAYQSNGTDAQLWSLTNGDRMRESLDKLAQEGSGLPFENEVLYIFNAPSANSVLDVAGGSSANKSNVQLYAINMTAAQRWRVICDEKGYVSIVNTGSNKVLDVSAGIAKSKTNVQQYAKNDTYAQKWVFQKNDDGSYTIKSALWAGLVLDASGSASHQNVQLGKEDKADASQKWRIFTEADIRSKLDQIAANSGRQLDDNGTYVIKSALSNTAVVDVKAGAIANKANVQLYSSNMTNAQLWRVVYDDKNYASFINLGSGKALDVSSGKATSKTNVQQFTYNNTYAQKWIVEKNADNTLSVFSALCPNVSLDVAGGKTSNGTNIQIYSGNGTSAQKWEFLSTNPEVGPCDDLDISDKWFEISPVDNSAYAIDVAAGSSSNGANVQLYKKNRTLAQLFRFNFVKTSQDKGYYQIVSAQSGKAIDVDDGNLVPSTNVQQWATDLANDNQLFSVTKNSDGTFIFKNKATGLVLDIKNGTVANYSNIQVYTQNGTNAQSFVLSERVNLINEGIFKVTSALSSSKVLDVKAASTGNGANVQLYGWNSSFAQKWEIKLVDDNTYTIQSVASGKYLTADQNGNVCQRAAASDGSQDWIPSISSGYYVLFNQRSGKVLDVASASISNGTNIQTYTANGTNAQRFKLNKVSAVAKATYHLCSAAGGSYVADVKSGSKSNGANVQLYKKNNTGAQKWNITENSDGSYTIINSASGKALDVKSAGATNGTNVQQYTKNGTKAQKWNIVYNSDGTFRLLSALKSDLALTANGSVKNGANLMVSVYTGSSLQKFTFEKTTYTPPAPPLPAAQQKMLNKIKNNTSKTSYLIAVNLSTHRVGIFSGSKGNWKIKYYWSCVTGAPGSSTITGSFYTTGYKKTRLSTDSRAKWATQIKGGYFFHTILASNSELGKSLSHGCVRLATSNAKWIYNNVKSGTRVVIYR